MLLSYNTPKGAVHCSGSPFQIDTLEEAVAKNQEVLRQPFLTYSFSISLRAKYSAAAEAS